MTAQALLATLPDSLHTHLRSGRELVRERAESREAPLPTGIEALDRLVGGGLPIGRLIEMVGRRSSGRWSLVLAILGTITRSGDSAALVDLGDGLDPQNATAVGIDLERLLWLRPKTTKQALVGAEMLLATGFPLVVLDLGTPPVPGGRGIESGWLRLARAASDQRASLLVTSPYRASGTAASVVLTVSQARAAWSGGGASPHLLNGLSARLRLEKAREALLEESRGVTILELASRAVA